MAEQPTRYLTSEEDSARWLPFRFRQGDIVISTRSKSGTTWMQMICALLVFRTAELPAPLIELSPWLDWLVLPLDEVSEGLEAQKHRRFIKTHTPLDGLPYDERAIYVVVARHPLDAAVSLYHQSHNLDRERMSEMIGDVAPEPAAIPGTPIRPWLREWMDWDGSPGDRLDSLKGFMWHLSDAWARRHEPNVVLVHYDDLQADLEREMERLSRLLDLPVADDLLPTLAEAATFEAMSARSDVLAPDPGGVMKSRSAFFRRGTSGAGAELLSRDDLDHYRQRTAELAPADLLEWLHR